MPDIAQDQHKPLRVLFVLPALTSGGAERVLLTLMNNLDPEKFSSVLISVRDEDSLMPIVRSGIPVVHLHRQSVSRSSPALFGRIWTLKPDIVVSTMTHMNFAVLLLRPFFPRTRFIVREAITPSFLLDAHPARASLIKVLYRMLYPLASVVVSPARLIFSEFSAMGLRLHHTLWLPNPVSLDQIRMYGVAAKPITGLSFIAAGRLHSQKGFDPLITALKDFDPGCPWVLFILGEGRERRALEKLIRDNGLQDKIKLIGHVITPWPYFASADAFLLPSLWEGLPNVVLESLACGTKVIALKSAGGIAEIAELAPDSVQVVDNVTAMVEAMKKVKPDPVPTIRPSLLPEIFEQDNVNKTFAALLSGG